MRVFYLFDVSDDEPLRGGRHGRAGFSLLLTIGREYSNVAKDDYLDLPYLVLERDE